MTTTTTITTTNSKKTTTTDLLNLAKRAQEFRSSDEFKAWLEFLGNFYNYSYNNTWLIFTQRPTATHVATYKKWEKMGRHVKKGEKGIAILVPCWKKKEGETRAEYVERTEKEYANFFIIGHVFDIAQTEGADLPTLDAISIEEQDTATDVLFDQIAQVSGYKVRFEDIKKEGLGGWCDHSAKEIVIDSKQNKAERIATLIHETAHALFEDEYKNYSRKENEIYADAVAYSVLTALDINPGNRNIKYLASWGADTVYMKILAPHIIKAVQTVLKTTQTED